MGAVPSRETLSRGLYTVRPPPTSHAGARKQDIVLIPLTKEFFPSPDCPLFVQFHRARCDAAVNYYFRQPGSPGDLSRIPATGADGDDSYPSREALYSGVVERMEEMLFDTDAEMCAAHNKPVGFSPTSSSAPSGRAGRRVLPVLCAVAFRYDPSRLSQAGGASVHTAVGASSHLSAGGVAPFAQSVGGHSGNGGTPSPPVAPAVQAAIEQGVYLCDSIVNIVGCFGFVPMEGAAHRAAMNSPPFAHSAHSPQETTSAMSGTFHRLSASMRSLGSSHASTPSYDPHRHTTSLSGVTVHLNSNAGVNYDHFVSLPPPVAAPLAAIVFLTKSAGEQNLSRVTFIAASTYYNQLIDAGLLQRGQATSVTHSPYQSRCQLPPLDTFSFSSLMTNVPILSFLYEMRCRWGYLGIPTNVGSSGAVSKHGSQAPSLNASTHSASTMGDAGSHNPSQRVDMEMWITEDTMFHGRISKELAERLCCALTERPEVMAQRTEPLPSEESFWRFRGLVDRHSPPPLPQSEGGDTMVDSKDVYVMGAAVMEGFDEGDVLRFDMERHVWVADRGIPLDAIVLAAMRPHCKRARESRLDDPNWVRVPFTNDVNIREDHANGDAMDSNDNPRETTRTSNLNPTDRERNEGEKAREAFETSAAASDEAHIEKGEGSTKLVHMHDGNFYVYRFELNGKTYYHGTIPDFANPNKNRMPQSLRDGKSAAAPPIPKTPQPKEERRPLRGRGGSGGFPSIASALFSLGPIGPEGQQTAATAYLPSRVTSSAIQMARRWMGSFMEYVGGRQPNRAAGGGPFPGSPQLTSPATPPSRRKPTFVRVGPDVTRNVEPPREAEGNGRGFVKRFVQDTRYMWEWRKSE